MILYIQTRDYAWCCNGKTSKLPGLFIIQTHGTAAEASLALRHKVSRPCPTMMCDFTHFRTNKWQQCCMSSTTHTHILAHLALWLSSFCWFNGFTVSDWRQAAVTFCLLHNEAGRKCLRVSLKGFWQKFALCLRPHHIYDYFFNETFFTIVSY